MERFRKIVPYIVYTAVVILAGAGVLSANEAEHEEVYTFVGDWLPRIINFGILAAVLFIFTRKPVRDAFAARTAEIAKSIQESREARVRASNALSEMEQKIKDLQAETARMIDEARARGEKDKQALIEEGKRVAAEVQAQVKTAVEIEVQKAKAGLAVEAALLSIDLAEGRIKEGMNAQDHERLLKEYIDKVGGRG